MAEDYSSPHRTGGRTLEGIPYTGRHPALPEAKRELVRDPAAPTESERRNLEFANRISNLRWTLRDENRLPTRRGPRTFELRVELEGSPATILTFSGAFAERQRGLNVARTAAREDSRFTIEGHCTDRDCEESVELSLSQSDAQGPRQARLLSRSYRAYTQIRRGRNFDLAQLEPDVRQRARWLDRVRTAWVINWIVTGGPSFHQVDLYGDGAGDRDLMYLFSLAAPLVQTKEYDVVVSVSGERERLPDEVELRGDEVEADVRTYRLIYANPTRAPGAPQPVRGPGEPETYAAWQVEALLDIIGTTVARPPAPTPAPAPVAQLRGVTANSFLKTAYGDPQKRLTRRMIDDFERTWALPQVQNWIAHWRDNRAETFRGQQYRWRDTGRNFFKNARPFTGYIERIYAHYDVPPVLAYNMPIESPYFTDPRSGYPIRSPGTSSALGPAQFIVDTARRAGLRVDGRVDERRYFMPSACGAAKFWRDLTQFIAASDLSIVILAYKLGEGGAGAIVQCIKTSQNPREQELCVQDAMATVKQQPIPGRPYRRRLPQGALAALRNYDFTLAELVRSNSIHEDDTRYVFQMLGLYFLGGDPQGLGYSLPSPSESPGRLPDNAFPPGGVGGIHSPECRSILAERPSA